MVYAIHREVPAVIRATMELVVQFSQLPWSCKSLCMKVAMNRISRHQRYRRSGHMAWVSSLLPPLFLVCFVFQKTNKRVLGGGVG